MTASLGASGETRHNTPASDRKINVGFVMEQALGHVTHHQNLAYWTQHDANVSATWLPVAMNDVDVWERVPGIRGNWSLKGSLRAREKLRAEERTQRFDALFIHTQTLSLFALDMMRRVPTVISLDATPLNYDSFGAEYDHAAAKAGWLARRKFRWNQRAFETCTALTTWSEWAKRSLVLDYGIGAQKVTVIPPGVDMQKWDFQSSRITPHKQQEQPLRLLFVGGDYTRKGGPELLEAFRSGLQSACALDIVTKDAQAAEALKGIDNVHVYTDLTANSSGLRRLYANADVFVFPTRGDCLGIAAIEAMAAGLPVIATNVGGLPEVVSEGVNSLMVAPGDAGGIGEAVRALIADPARRKRMGRASRELAEQRFDAARNYNAILTLIKTTANAARHF